MALQGCIGENHFLTRMAIKRFWLWDRLCEGEIDGDEHSVKLFDWWKERHGHNAKPLTTRGPARAISSPDKKWCYQCSQEKFREIDFSVDRSRGDGRANQCKACAAQKWKAANSQLCRICECICIGDVCIRCYRWKRVVFDAELVINIIPSMLAAKERELLEPLSKAHQSAYREAKKLRDRALQLRGAAN